MSVTERRASRASITHPSGGAFPNSTRASRLSRQLHQPYVTTIEYKSDRFLITDQPSRMNMESFVVTCIQNNVRILVRVCEPTYDEAVLEAAGIRVIDLEFNDGEPPPMSVIDSWFRLIKEVRHDYPEAAIAVHCKAGLGRAPVIVAAALMELGLSFEETVELIRSRREGSLNSRQLDYLRNFQPQKRLRSRSDRCHIL